MPFDLTTAKPLGASGSSGFDLSTAKPVTDDIESPKKESFGEKIQGYIEPAATMATGAIAMPIGAAGGVLKSITGGKYGTQEGVKQGEDTASKISSALTYQPRTQSGKENLESISGLFDKSKLAGLGPSEAMALGGASQGVGTQLGQVPKQAISAAGALPKKALGKIGESVISPDKRALAQKAEGYGIPLRPDMLTDNKFARMAGEFSEQLPLTGDKGGARQDAFNSAIIKTVGAEGDKLTPAVYDKALRTNGAQIGTLSKKPIPYFDTKLRSSLDERLAQANNFETSDVSKVVGSYVREIKNKIGEDGTIDGVAFRKIRTKLIGQMRRTDNGDLKHALSEIDEDMLDAIKSQLNPEESQIFNDARAKYARLKVIEPLVAKSKTGDISAASLMNAMTSDKTGKSLMARGRGGDLVSGAADA